MTDNRFASTTRPFWPRQGSDEPTGEWRNSTPVADSPYPAAEPEPQRPHNPYGPQGVDPRLSNRWAWQEPPEQGYDTAAVAQEYMAPPQRTSTMPAQSPPHMSPPRHAPSPPRQTSPMAAQSPPLMSPPPAEPYQAHMSPPPQAATTAMPARAPSHMSPPRPSPSPHMSPPRQAPPQPWGPDTPTGPIPRIGAPTTAIPSPPERHTGEQPAATSSPPRVGNDSIQPTWQAAPTPTPAQTDPSYFSTGRLLGTVGIVFGVIVVIVLLIMTLGFISDAGGGPAH